MSTSTSKYLSPLKYLVTSLLPSSTGVVPTACFTTQEDLMMCGMSLNRALRRRAASWPFPPRNLARLTSKGDSASLSVSSKSPTTLCASSECQVLSSKRLPEEESSAWDSVRLVRRREAGDRSSALTARWVGVSGGLDDSVGSPDADAKAWVQPGGTDLEAQDMTRLRKGGPGTMKFTTNVKGASLFLMEGRYRPTFQTSSSDSVRSHADRANTGSIAGTFLRSRRYFLPRSLKSQAPG
mmetsp:Transcript_385/g.1137  ORF Transcript_385/g.1137 Transcript_385/m.1137 type:complete len:239 (-) Transcript_385:2515-3231(-)